jgi:hypothetical protein
MQMDQYLEKSINNPLATLRQGDSDQDSLDEESTSDEDDNQVTKSLHFIKKKRISTIIKSQRSMSLVKMKDIKAKIINNANLSVDNTFQDEST